MIPRIATMIPFPLLTSSPGGRQGTSFGLSTNRCVANQRASTAQQLLQGELRGFLGEFTVDWQPNNQAAVIAVGMAEQLPADSKKYAAESGTPLRAMHRVSDKEKACIVAGNHSMELLVSSKRDVSQRDEHGWAPYLFTALGEAMSYVYKDVATLTTAPPHAAVGGGDCVELIKHFVPGLKGILTAAWRAGKNVLDEGAALEAGTAIATFDNGRYPNHSHGNHAARVLMVMPSGICVLDQWKGRAGIRKRFIFIPPPHSQKNRDGTFMDASNNALAFFVIEK